MNEQEIFQQALERTDPSDRAAYLDRACGRDTPLRQRIVRLLALHERAGSFLEHPPAEELIVESPEDGPGPETSAADEPTLAPGPPNREPDAGKPSGGEAVTPGAGTRVRYVGDYELIEEIGRGGMGVVYKARQVSLNRIVAVKMIVAGQLASEADVERFRTEAQAAAQLQHPSIVTVHEVGHHEGQQYFSMDYVEGPSLAESLRDGPWPAREAAVLVKTLAEAVHHAHSHGILHRDLKPSNILLARRGPHGDSEIPDEPTREASEARDEISAGPQTAAPHQPRSPVRFLPRITDFGLAKQFEQEATPQREELTATGQVLGTPGYMAPEQAAGAKRGKLGPPTDVYALGAILYELLTGRPPFQAATPVDTILQALDQDPVPPRQLNRAVPRDLETICLKCLEKEPRQRYATAQGLADDLERFLTDRPIRAHRVGPTGRAWRWLRRQRRSVALAAGATAITVLVVLAASISWMGYQRRQLGYLSIRTDALALVADVLDAHDTVIQSRVGIPTDEPVRVPAGDYRIRVMGRGSLSEDYRMYVSRREQHEISVSLDDRQLWEPLKIEKPFEIVRLADHADTILLKPTGLARIDGRTGQPIWEMSFADQSEPLLPGVERDWESSFPRDQDDRHKKPPQLVRPPADLNGDGTLDLVWAMTKRAALVAVSGADGQVIWCHDAEVSEDDRDSTTGRRGTRRSKPGTVAGNLTVVDVDEDGASDFIAAFASVNSNTKRERGELTDVTRCVEAVSGRTGERIWRATLDNEWFQVSASAIFPSQTGRGDASFPPTVVRSGFPCWLVRRSSWGHSAPSLRPMSSFVYPSPVPQGALGDLHREPGAASYGGEWALVPFPPARLRIGSDHRIVVIAGSQLVTLNLKTGRRTAGPHDLGFVPARPPVLGDLTGDGTPEAVLLRRVKAEDENRSTATSWDSPDGSGTGPRSSWKTRVVAVDLQSGNTLWQTEVRARTEAYFTSDDLPADWPLVVDLDDPADGRCEVIVPDGRLSRTSAELALAYRTGTRRLWGGLTVLNGQDGVPRWHRTLKTLDNQLHRMTVGPDIDGNGMRDVFTASIVADASSFWLYVDAFSGDDGRTLWWWNQRVPDQFAAANIRSIDLRGVGVGPLRWWQTGADGWPQLVVPYMSFRSLNYPRSPAVYVLSASTGRLAHVGLNIDAPQLADLDSDGNQDLWAFRPTGADHPGRGSLIAIAGRSAGWQRTGLAAVPFGEFNGDGIDDLVAVAADSRNAFAISGRDGSLLWRSDIRVHVPSSFGVFRSVLAEPPASADLDKDGATDVFAPSDMSVLMCRDVNQNEETELLVVAHPNASWSTPSLRAISGRDGKVLWSRDFPTGSFGGEPGDAAPARYALLAGRDGTLLWEKPLGAKLPYLIGGLEYYVSPATADLDGDGTLDFLLPVVISELQCELHAVSGTDGHLLWKHTMSPRENSFYLYRNLPVPVIADLEGDGHADVVVLDYLLQPGTDVVSAPKTCRMSVLSGADGKVKWTWEEQVHAGTGRVGKQDADMRPVPLVVNLDGSDLSKRGLCIWTWASNGHVQFEFDDETGSGSRSGSVDKCPGSLIVLGGTGTVLWRANVTPLEYDGKFRVWAHDVDHDGTDELLYIDQGEVRAVRASSGELAWSWPVPDRFGNVVGMEDDPRDSTAQVIVKSRHLYALDGRSGELIWKSDSRLVSNDKFIPIGLVRSRPSPTQPRLVYWSNVPRTAGIATICRLPVNVGATAAVPHEPPSAPAVQRQEPDPRLVRQPPWVHLFGTGLDWHDIGEAVAPFVLLILIPGLAAYRAVRRRQFTVGELLLAVPLYVALVASLYVVDPWALTVPLERCPEEVINGALVSVPVLLLLWAFVRCSKKGQRRWAVLLLVAHVLIVICFGIYLLARDAPFKEPWERYDWSAGWPWAMLLPAWFTGWLVAGTLCLVALRWLAIRLWRLVASRKQAARA